MPSIRHRYIFFLLLLLPGAWTLAQTRLSLPYCLETAVTNSIQIQQTTNSLELSEVNLIVQKFAFLPGVNGGASVSKSFGTSVDNFTQQIAESPYTGSPNLGASLSLFQGMSKWNNLKKAKYSLESANYSLEDLKNDIRLNVAAAFFQVIFAEDQLKLAKERADLLQKQLERVQAQFEAGVKTEGDVYGVKAQLATERVSLVQQENTFKRNLLNLVQSMNLDPSEKYLLMRPNLPAIDALDDLPAVEAIFLAARASNPGLRAKAMDILSMKYAMKSTKAIFYPSVNLSYGMGSFYSSNNRPLIRLDPGPNGTFVPVYGSPKPLGEQLSSNFGQNLSMGISVPIFMNYSLRSSMASARVSYENALLAEQNESNDLYKAIQGAYFDLIAAKAQLDASEEQIVNVREAYTYAEAKYESGILDFYTMIEVLNNKTKAEAGLNQARYDFLLKQKIIELYQGKQLTF